LDREMLTAIIILSILTTVCGPFLIEYFIKKRNEE